MKLVSAVEFLHVKNILNLNLSEITIVSRHSFRYEPVIIDFSCACHITSAKLLSQYFQEMFKSSAHLPRDVVEGKRVPSYNSDLYSIGVLISHFSGRLKYPEDQIAVDMVALKLLKNKGQTVPNFLYDFLKIHVEV